MNSTTGALIFFFGLLSICLLAFASPLYYPIIYNLRAPKITVRAEVIDKNERISKRRISPKSTFGVIVFEAEEFQTEDDEFPEVLVNEAQYKKFEIGARGTLTYKGTKFICFDPEY